MKPRQLILAPAHNHQQIMADLLQDKQALENVALLPFNVFIKSMHDDVHPIKSFSQAYSQIMEKRSLFTNLKDSLVYPEILKQLIDFHKECLLYDIDIESLPTDNQKEKEIKIIMETLAQVYSHLPHFQDLKTQITDASHVTIHPFFKKYTDKNIVALLEVKNAQSLTYPKHKQAQQLVYYALNHAHEAEATAQWLLQNQDQKTLIICCDVQSVPLLLIAALKRYNLEFEIDFGVSQPLVVNHLRTLINFLKHKDMDALLVCLTSYIFNQTNFNDLARYLQMSELTYDDLFKPFVRFQNKEDYHTISSRDFYNLNTLENQAEQERLALVEILKAQTKDDYSFAFDVLAQSLQAYPQNHAVLLQIKDVIEHVHFNCETDETRDVLIDYFLDDVHDVPMKTKANIHITTLNQGHQVGYDTMIVLGANQQNFPNFVKPSGLIDETYLEKTNYPSLAERLAYHLEQLNYLHDNAPTIIYSYATATFEGKTLVAALELTKDLPQQPWPMQVFGSIPEKQYQLDPDLAKALFFKGNVLRGSVSAFELYFNCPYRYFLKYGLRLSPHDGQPTIVALMGTIAHALVENIHVIAPTPDGIDVEALRTMLHEYFGDLYRIYPNKRKYWEFVEARFYEQLSVALYRLLKFEAASDFEFYQSEYDFFDKWELSEQYTLALRGFVDRMDGYQDFVRIIDYKSSAHNLSYPRVKAGLQLQLLTYALVVDANFNQKVSGVHYFSFLNEVVKIVHAKISRNKIIELDMNDFEEIFLKAHKLSGWFFDQDVSMYHSDWFVKNITKNLNLSKNGYYDLKQVREFFHTIYLDMAQNLAAGNIERAPVKDACTYCDFRYICVFKDAYRDVKDLAPHIEIKGDPEDADKK